MQEIAQLFEDRLKEAIKPERLKPWCERNKINYSTLNSAFQRKSVPTAELLIQVSLALGKSIDWLLGLTNEPSRLVDAGAYLVEDGPRSPVLHLNEPSLGSEVDWSDFIQIPLYAVSASAGHGAYVDRETIKCTLAFRRSFICDRLLISHHDLFCVEVDGISMEPALRNTHPALVDPRDTVNLREGPYLLRLEGSLLLKNLQRLPGGHLRIWSENQATNAYPPIEVAWPPREGVDLQILGRVRWSDIVF